MSAAISRMVNDARPYSKWTPFGTPGGAARGTSLDFRPKWIGERWHFSGIPTYQDLRSSQAHAALMSGLSAGVNSRGRFREMRNPSILISTIDSSRCRWGAIGFKPFFWPWRH